MAHRVDRSKEEFSNCIKHSQERGDSSGIEVEED